MVLLAIYQLNILGPGPLGCAHQNAKFCSTKGLISTYKDIILPLYHRNLKRMSSYVDLILFQKQETSKKKKTKKKVILWFYLHQVPISPNSTEKLKIHVRKEVNVNALIKIISSLKMRNWFIIRQETKPKTARALTFPAVEDMDRKLQPSFWTF